VERWKGGRVERWNPIHHSSCGRLVCSSYLYIL